MFAVPREQVVRVHASSGTTGKATVVGYTQDDIDTWAQLVARSIRAAGGRPGDTVHVAYGYGLFTGGPRAPHRARGPRCPGVPLFGGPTPGPGPGITHLPPPHIIVPPAPRPGARRRV